MATFFDANDVRGSVQEIEHDDDWGWYEMWITSLVPGELAPDEQHKDLGGR